MLAQASITLLAFASLSFAAAPPIGIIRASGHFTVEGSQIWGNSTLFDGATIETDSASSDLSLRNGVRVQLGKESRARVWENHLLLEKGSGQVSGGTGFEMDAAGLKIRSVGAGSQVRVGIGSTKEPGIQVAAVNGSARVSNATGLVLASVAAGRILNFPMQAAQAGTLMRIGCLLYKEGQYILQDDTTQEISELRGQDLAINTGNRVEISGLAAGTRPTVSIATLLINVTAVSPRSQGGCLSVASALSAQTNAPQVSPTTAGAKPATTGAKGSEGGMSTGAKVAIVAVIGGGAAGAAVALGGGKKSTSP